MHSFKWTFERFVTSHLSEIVENHRSIFSKCLKSVVIVYSSSFIPVNFELPIKYKSYNQVNIVSFSLVTEPIHDKTVFQDCI